MLKHAYSEQETKEIAAAFAKTLKPYDVVCLHGDLGAGKTAFCRAVIRTLLNDPDCAVPSPTFSLLQTYDTGHAEIWHYDLYRIEESEEIYELGWEEALSGKIVLVEWPERLGSLYPESAIQVKITIPRTGTENEKRDIEIT